MSVRAFTLIELLIVVLIIAILAAIAVPNFLEFQTRAKVSRVKSDMRSTKTAIEAYRVDIGEYPIHNLYAEPGNRQYDRGAIYGVTGLSTPVSYISSVDLKDPFYPAAALDQFGDVISMAGHSDMSNTFNYINIELYRRPRSEYNWGNDLPKHAIGYALVSYGPDTYKGPVPGLPALIGSYGRVDPQTNEFYATAQYDPTNGTVSGGDILMWPGGGR